MSGSDRHYADRLRYLRGTAERIPVVDAFFDAVISVNAIDHVDDFAQAANEIHRVLRPGGLLRMEVHYPCRRRPSPGPSTTRLSSAISATSVC